MTNSNSSNSQLKVPLDDLPLTELERKFLKAFIKLLYAEPGFSDVDIKDISKAIQENINTCKGILGSLIKKEIVYNDNDEQFHGIIYLEEKYYYLHPEWKIMLNL